MLPRTGLAAALILVGALTLTSCAGDLGTVTPNDPGNGSSADDGTPGAGSNALDADGYAIPGQVVELNLGDSVTYYSMPKLTKDDVQKVTIHSFEYFEKSELPASAPLDKITTGMLVLTLSWEGVAGSVQSNQGYVLATLDDGTRGIPWAFLDDRLRNGRVPLGETQTGTFSIEIERGKTTLTIVDYQDEPVARIHIDTSR